MYSLFGSSDREAGFNRLDIYIQNELKSQAIVNIGNNWKESHS